MRLPAVLVVTVYVTALAVALREPSEHLLAGSVLLLALCARVALRPAGRAAIAHAVAATAGPRARPVEVAVPFSPVEEAVPPAAPG